MLSDFQNKKLHKIFDTFDIVKDQHLDWADFDEAAKRYIAAHNLAEGSPKAKELHEIYLHLWEECIQKPCDVSNDAKVNVDEWINAFYTILNTRAGHEDIDFIGKAIYESIDINHDRRVTLEEFTIFHKVYNIYDEKLTPEVFSIIDNNHNGTLSKEEIIEAINQFFYSNNPKSPGNYLFGKL